MIKGYQSELANPEVKLHFYWCSFSSRWAFSGWPDGVRVDIWDCFNFCQRLNRTSDPRRGEK